MSVTIQLRSGKGKYTYSNGDVYTGDLVNNVKHGIGRLVYADKSEYYGQWQGGVKIGEGMFIYPNKDIFSGNWLNGRKHGQGTYVFNATGMKYIGEWVENRFLSGRWAYPNGTYF